MGHVPQLPRGKLPIHSVDLIQQVSRLLIVLGEIKFPRGGDRISAIALIFVIECGHDRPMYPGFNALRKEGRIQQGKRKTLGVVDELLQLKV